MYHQSYLIPLLKTKPQHYRYFLVYGWSLFPSDCLSYQDLSHCEATAFPSPVRFFDSHCKKELLGSENHLFPLHPFPLLLPVTLTAEFLITRPGQWVTHIYSKSMPDDTGLWYGWARTSLLDLSVLQSMFWLAYSLFLLLALCYSGTFGFSKGNLCCFWSHVETQSQKDDSLYNM